MTIIKSVAFIFAFFSLHLAKAQVSISSEFLPHNGTSYNYYSSSTSLKPIIPSSGHNIRWDYNNWEPTDTHYVEFSSVTSGSAADPSLARIIKIGSRAISYSLYKQGTHGLYVYKSFSANSSDTSHLIIPELTYTAPLSYGEAFQDSSLSSIIESTNDSLMHHWFSKSLYEAIGYGSIVTKSGTYKNVLLVKNKKVNYDTTFTIKNGKPILINGWMTDSIISYDWIQGDKGLPVVYSIYNHYELFYHEIWATMYYYQRNSLISGNLSENLEMTKVYPLPADNLLNIQFKNQLSGKLSIFTAEGKIKTEFDFVHTDHLNCITASLEKGLYIVEIKTDDGSRIRKRFLVLH